MNYSFKKDYFKPMVAVFLPQVITGSVGLIQSFVSTMLAGDFGINAIAVVAFVGLIFGLIFVIANGFNVAISTILSINFGAKNHKQIVADYWQGLYFNFLLGIIAAFLCLSSILWGYLFGYHNQFKLLVYFSFGAFGIFIIVFMTGLTSIMLSNLGLAKYSTYISSTLLILTIFEQYFIVRGFFGYGKWGLEPIAIVTLINSYISFFLQFLVLLFHRNAKHLRIWIFRFPALNITRCKLFIKNGWPNSTAALSKMGLVSFGGFILNGISTEQFAVFELTFIAAEIMFVISIAYAMATGIVFAKALGAKDTNKAKFIYRSSNLMQTVTMLIVAILIFIFRDDISKLFVKEEPIIQLLSITISIAVIAQIFNSYTFLANSILRAIQDYKYVSRVNIISYLILGLPICLVLPHLLWQGSKLGASGFWLGFLIVLLLNTALLAKKITSYFRIPPQQLLNFIDQKTSQGKLLKAARFTDQTTINYLPRSPVNKKIDG